ncbi:hypothetical protein NECID01_1679 [Nematocida sp. AWRm77]|nr:hypothetical protein NECID01_1679 [Nematocida sp. AWRm77]
MQIFTKIKRIVTKVFTWGAGDAGQLGDGTECFQRVNPKEIPFFNDKEIVEVVCGGMHAIARSNNGHLYSWGCNDEGVLGREGPEDTPKQIDFGGKFISYVVAGDSISAALDLDGNLWTWGLYRGPGGVIGHSVEGNSVVKIQRTPERVEGMSPSYIYAGTNHILAVDGKNVLWAWGDSAGGKLGYHVTRNKVKINLTPRITLRTVAGAGAGAYHSIAFKLDRMLNRTRKGKKTKDVFRHEIDFYDEDGNRYYVKPPTDTDLDQILLCVPENGGIPVLKLKTLKFKEFGYDTQPEETIVHEDEAARITSKTRNGSGLLTGVPKFVYESPEEREVRESYPNGMEYYKQKRKMQEEEEEESRRWAEQERKEFEDMVRKRKIGMGPAQPNNQLWMATAGANNYGQAPNSHEDGTWKWSKIEPGKGPQTFKKAMGGEHSTMVLDREGTLWGIGRNDYGQLGCGDYQNRKSFTKCDIKEPVSDFSMTASHGLALAKGKLYSWGFGEEGQLGYEAEMSCSPTQVNFPVKGPIISMGAGGQHSAAVAAIDVTNDPSFEDKFCMKTGPVVDNVYFSRHYPYEDWRKFYDDVKENEEEIKKSKPVARSKDFSVDTEEKELMVQYAYALQEIFDKKVKERPHLHRELERFEVRFHELDPQPEVYSEPGVLNMEYFTWINRKINYYAGRGLLHEVLVMEDEIQTRLWCAEKKNIWARRGYVKMQRICEERNEGAYQKLPEEERNEVARMYGYEGTLREGLNNRCVTEEDTARGRVNVANKWTKKDANAMLNPEPAERPASPSPTTNTTSIPSSAVQSPQSATEEERPTEWPPVRVLTKEEELQRGRKIYNDVVKMLKEKEREKERLREQEREREQELLREQEQERQRVEEQERLRVQAEEQEKLRLKAQFVEQERVRLLEMGRERLRLQAEERERQRVQAEAEERERQRVQAEAEEKERLRVQILAEEQEKLKLRQQVEAEEKERLRVQILSEEQEKLRQQVEDEEKERLRAQILAEEHQDEAVKRQHPDLEESERKKLKLELKTKTEAEEDIAEKKDKKDKKKKKLKLKLKTKTEAEEDIAEKKDKKKKRLRVDSDPDLNESERKKLKKASTVESTVESVAQKDAASPKEAETKQNSLLILTPPNDLSESAGITQISTHCEEGTQDSSPTTPVSEPLKDKAISSSSSLDTQALSLDLLGTSSEKTDENSVVLAETEDDNSKSESIVKRKAKKTKTSDSKKKSESSKKKKGKDSKSRKIESESN